MHCSSEQLMVAGEVGRLAGAAPERGNTDQLLDLLRSACRFEAKSLVRWSADDGDHVGVGVANHRYDDDMHQYFIDQFPSTVASERVHGGRLPLRFDDAPYDFRESETYLEQLHPRGFDDGLTAGLFLETGQYVGMLHMNSSEKHQFDNDVRDYVEALSCLIAGIVVRECPTPLRRTVNWAGRDEPPMTIVRAAEQFMRGRSMSLSTLWHHGGTWKKIQFARSADEIVEVDVTAHPLAIPYHLTRRELEIATAVASGLSNRAIASYLRISPRTVGKHVERVLDKLDCSSRSQAAAMCVLEGIIDLDLIVDARAGSRLLGYDAVHVRRMTY